MSIVSCFNLLLAPLRTQPLDTHSDIFRLFLFIHLTTLQVRRRAPMKDERMRLRGQLLRSGKLIPPLGHCVQGSIYDLYMLFNLRTREDATEFPKSPSDFISPHFATLSPLYLFS